MDWTNMDTYNEQAPFTKEQFEYLQTKFISKNIVWHSLKESVEAEKIAFPTDWAKAAKPNLSYGDNLCYLERQKQIVKLIDRQFDIISDLQALLSESNTESVCSSLESATNALNSLLFSLTSDRL